VKRLNPRRVKIHRSYTVEEVARLFRVHKNTVRAWVKAGLPAIDGRRPLLILGRDLASFLFSQRQRKRQSCRSGQLYCLRCRAPKNPAVRMADYIPITSRLGNLRGLCPDCGRLMYRLVSQWKLREVAGDLEVQVAQAQQRIKDSACSRLNSDFDEVA
jgi:hypothetical protein